MQRLIPEAGLEERPWSQGLRVTAAGAYPAEGVSFLLQKDAGTWVVEPVPHRALEAPGEGIPWAGEGLLGPVAGCS